MEENGGGGGGRNSQKLESSETKTNLTLRSSGPRGELYVHSQSHALLPTAGHKQGLTLRHEVQDIRRCVASEDVI